MLYNSQDNIELISPMNQAKQCILEVRLVSAINATISTRILKAIIDTGSYYNFIRRSAADLSHIKDENKVVAFEPMGESSGSGNLYSCNLLIPSLSLDSVIPDFTFILHDKVFTSVDIILGTNFLQHFVFKYNFPNEGEFFLGLISI